MTYEFAAYRAGDDVPTVTATQTLVLVDLAERKAVSIPESYREAIRGFEGDSLWSDIPRKGRAPVVLGTNGRRSCGALPPCTGCSRIQGAVYP